MTKAGHEFPIDYERTQILRLIESGGGWSLELAGSSDSRRFALDRAMRRHLRVLLPDSRSFPPETDLIALPKEGRIEVTLGERRLLALILGHTPRLEMPPYLLSPFETRFLADNGRPHPIGTCGVKAANLTTDLHTHLAGCVHPIDLIEIGTECNIAYPSEILEQAGVHFEKSELVSLPSLAMRLRAALASQLALRLDRQVPFPDLEKVYRLRAPIMKNRDAFVPILRRIAADYARMGVLWAELSFFGILDGEFLELAHRELPSIKRATGVDVRFLVAFSRHDDFEWDLDLLDRIDQLIASPYIAGVDFMGQETNSTHDFAPQLRAVAEWAHKQRPGFVVRVHAGENPAFPENVRVAVETVAECRVRLRIGHGLYGTDASTLSLLRDTDTIVEFNLNSNLALNNLESAAQIPLIRYLDAGVPCVLGTDGYGIYGTNPELEAQAGRLAGLTDEGLEFIRATERRYIEERRRHEADFFDRLEKFKIPLQLMPARHYLPEVLTKKTEAIERRDRALSARLDDLGVHVLAPEEADELIEGRYVLSIAGAWRKSWDAISTPNQNRVRRLLDELVAGLDATTVIVAGGTGSGVEGIVQREARSRGLTVLGTLVRATPPDGLEDGLLTHATLLAEKLYDKASRLYPFIKKHGGLCVFIGGGHIVADEIQAAANLRLPYLVLQDIEGASGLHAVTVPERAFTTAEEVLDCLCFRAPWHSTRDPYWHTGMNPVVDIIVGRRHPSSDRIQVLLVRRDDDAASEPGAWALPGGFQLTDAPRGTPWTPGLETAEEAVVRELLEETGLDISLILDQLNRVGEYEGNGRDPRDTPEAWSRSRAFAIQLNHPLSSAPIAGGDDATDAGWFDIEKLPRLAFDHQTILEDGLGVLVSRHPDGL